MNRISNCRQPALLALALASVALLWPQPARPADAPRQVIQNGSEEVRSILRKKARKGSAAEQRQKDKLKTVVDRFLDYHELSRRALGPHWKQRTAAEQKEFVDLLRDLIEASYTGSIRKNVNYTLEIEDEEIADEDGTALVSAVASAKNSKGRLVSEDLTFHLYLKKHRWMIYDVEFGDLSLVRHYRGEFNRKIKKESYAALVDVMRKKLEEVKAGKVEKKITL